MAFVRVAYEWQNKSVHSGGDSSCVCRQFSSKLRVRRKEEFANHSGVNLCPQKTSGVTRAVMHSGKW